MLSKKILAAALSLTMACSAAVTGFSVVDTDISADAASTVQADTYNGTFNLVFGKPNVVSANYNYNKFRYNFNLTQSGKITVSPRNLYNVALYNSNGTTIDQYMSSGDSVTLNAGSYYFVVTAYYSKDQGNGEFFVGFTPSGETFKDSGEGIATNNTVVLPSKNGSVKKIKGFFAEHSNDISDSFKINISSRTGLVIGYSDGDNSMSCEIEVYNSKKQRIYYNDYVTDASYANKCYLKLNKGTYYVRIINKYPILHRGQYYLSFKKYNPKTSHVLKVNTKKVNNKSVSDYSGTVSTWTNNSKDKITFKSSNKNIFTVTSYGTVKFKNPGKAYLYVTAGSSEKYDAVTKKIPIYVTPKEISSFNTKVLSNTSTTATSKISWSRDTKATGYIVKYSSKKTSTGKLVKPKRIKLSSNKKNYFILSNKKIGVATYFQVCSYKKIGSKVVYGPMSYTRSYKTIRRYY